MERRQKIYDRIFAGTIDSKLEYAEKLFRQLHPLLLNDDVFTKSFLDLQDNAVHLSLHMKKMAIGKHCIHCATSENGGCCSLAMANETDAIQLLVNKLAGISVEKVRSDGRECCFLTEKGCLFTFKPMFCLNYNCGRIMDAASSNELDLLSHLSGNILRQQYCVENHILLTISQNASLNP